SDVEHFGQVEHHPHSESRGRYGREGGGPDQAPDPHAVDDVETGVERHHGDGGSGEAKNGGAQGSGGQPPGRREDWLAHGGTSVRNRVNTGLAGYRAARSITRVRASAR